MSEAAPLEPVAGVAAEARRDFSRARVAMGGPRPATLHAVLENRDLSASTFVLKMESNGFSYRPGQWINLGRPGSIERREYTVYSPPGRESIEVLIREVEGGTVSRDLRRCRPGDVLEVDGPHGAFCIDQAAASTGRFLFVATGTGVSPFHCFALSYPGLSFVVLHGARSSEELYERHVFDERRFVACLSRGPDDGSPARAYGGRVTSYLRENPVEPASLCYLCGNSDMIYETYAILRGYGVAPSRIFAEVYF